MPAWGGEAGITRKVYSDDDKSGSSAPLAPIGLQFAIAIRPVINNVLR